MIDLHELVIKLPTANYKKGLNQAKKATGVVYYTSDTPKWMLDTLAHKRLFPVAGTSDRLAKKLGKNYLIHFITVNGDRTTK